VPKRGIQITASTISVSHYHLPQVIGSPPAADLIASPIQCPLLAESSLSKSVKIG